MISEQAEDEAPESEEMDEQSVEKQNLEMKFSNNIASEFTQTMNEFTAVCAKMIEKRSVDKDLYDKFNDLHAKIKNLVDAARNSKS